MAYGGRVGFKRGTQQLSGEKKATLYKKSIGGKEKGIPLKDTKTMNIQKQVSKAPKFKASMVPGLETLVKAVESMPDDFRAKRYWTLGLKSLGILATPILAYDGYTAIRDGLPPDEVVAKTLLGADRVIYKGKEYLTMSPEARAAKGRKTRQTMAEAAKEDPRVKGYAEMYGVEGKFKPDFIKEGDEELIEAAEKKYADFREKKDAARASERAGIAKWYKDRIYGVPLEEVTREWNNQGGRVGFAKGPKDPSKRAFIKGVTALAALPIVGKYFKVGKFLSKTKPYLGPVIEKVKGMPDWFPGLVKKLWNEGDDVTKTVATGERQVVKRGTLEGGDDVDLVYQIDTGDVRIDVAPKKGTYETTSGAYNKEYELYYQKGKADELTKGKKPPDEFSVSEVEGTVDPHALDVNWDGRITDVDDAMSDLTEIEAFAKSKSTKQIHKQKGTKKKDVAPDYELDPYYDLFD
jgi:hypothetical protein